MTFVTGLVDVGAGVVTVGCTVAVVDLTSIASGIDASGEVK